MKEKIKELQMLLEKGYEHFFANGGNHFKSSEGAIEVTFCYPSRFEEGYIGSNPNYYVIRVYSYVLGPHRWHEFSGETFDEAYKKAYEEVKSWVDDELSTSLENAKESQ